MEGNLEITENSTGSFENQFANSRKIETAVGEVEYVDLKPAEVTDPTPIVLVPGWGETFKTHKETLRTIFDQRRRAISIKFPRNDGFGGRDFPEAEIEKAEALSDVVADTGTKKVDIIAHSEGALNSTIVADLYPQNIRNIVFVDPAGLIEKDSTVKLAARFSTMLTKDAVRLAKGEGPRKEMLRAAWEAVKYFVSNPKRAIEEASAISKSDIYETLSSLQELGIGVSIIHGAGDTVFPMKRVIEAARQKGKIDTEGFYSVKGDHREISVHPEKYAALAVNALNNLQANNNL